MEVRTIEIFKLFGSILIDDKEAMKSLSSVEKKFENLGGKLEKFGKGMMLKVTTPILAAGTAAAKFATDLNKDMALINTLIPGQSERILELKDKIRDVAMETGKFTDEIASGTYDVISAYGDAADTMDKVGINAKAATAGVATTSDALNLSSAIMKGYGDTSAEANSKVMDLAFTTLKLGQTSFPDLAASMGKVVPMSNELGIAQEELFAIYATGTGVTGNASEVSTQYQSVLKSLMTPTKSMTGLMKDMGVEDGKAMIAKYGLGDSIKMIVEESKSSKTPLSEYIGSVNGQVIALALAGEQSVVFAEKLGELQNSTGAMEVAFEEVTEGVNATGFSWQQSMVKMQVATQKMGDVLAPVLSKGADLISKVTDKLNDLTPAQLENIAKFAALAAVIGPVLFVGGKLVAGIGTVIGVVTTVSGAIAVVTTGATAATPAIGALAAVFTFITGPIGLTIAAIIALIAIGVLLYKNWDTVKEKATEFGNKITETWDNVKLKTVEAWDNVKESVTDTITGLASDAVQWGKDIVTGLWNGITGAKDWVVGKVSGFASDIAGGFKKIFRISSPSKLMAEYGGNIVDGLVEGIDGNKHKGLSAMTKMAKEITGEFDKLGTAVITALKKRYQEEERLQLNSLQKQVDTLRNKTDEKLKQYDRELQAKLEVLDTELSEEEKRLQAQIDAINGLTKQEEEELKEQEYRNKVAQKEKELQDAESAEERAKIQEELNKLRADKEREHLLKHRQMQISALQQEMTTIREQAQEKRNELQLEYEDKKKNEENKLAVVITNLESEMEATKIHYATLLEEENLQAEARRLILDENNQELISLLESYNPAWQNAGQSFGESLLEGLNSMKSSIQDAVSEILSMVETADMANARIIQAKVDYQDAFERGDKTGMDTAHQRAESERKKGGTIGADETLAGARVTQNITINSPTPLSPAETARQMKNASRELAMGV